MEHAIYIPRYLNERERILIFDLIELMMLLGGLGLGIAFKNALAGVVFGIVAFMFSRWCKRRGYFEVFPNILYGTLPTWLLDAFKFKLKGTPPAYCRVMTG